MQTRLLPGAGLTVSRACLGTMTFGAQADFAASARMLDLALDRGVNFVDTANVYAGGESERILGELLAGRRHTVVLASKAGMKVGDEKPGLSRDALLAAVENSLRRLRTDYLDLYYLHLPDYAVPFEETLAAADELVRSGKVRHVAASNFASWQTVRMLWLAESRGYAAPRVAQPMYNLLARRIEDEFLPACREYGIGTVAYNPLAGGLLTGKQHAGAPLKGTRFDGNKTYTDRYWNDGNFEAVARLSEAASKEGRSLVSVSLNWILHHSPADCLILGASKPEQLEGNLAALEEGPLAPETLAVCEEVWTGLKGAAPKYNR